MSRSWMGRVVISSIEEELRRFKAVDAEYIGEWRMLDESRLEDTSSGCAATIVKAYHGYRLAIYAKKMMQTLSKRLVCRLSSYLQIIIVVAGSEWVGLSREECSSLISAFGS